MKKTQLLVLSLKVVITKKTHTGSIWDSSWEGWEWGWYKGNKWTSCCLEQSSGFRYKSSKFMFQLIDYGCKI